MECENAVAITTGTATTTPSTDTMNKIKNFLNDESGLELSEYAVATALIVAAVVLAFTNLGSGIKGRLNALTGVITGIS